MKTHTRPFWLRKRPCLFLTFLLVLLMALSPTITLLAESDTGDTDEITSEETDDLESPAQIEEPENTTYENSISGTLWLDANEDGTYDADEQPIEGYSVSLYAENDRDNAVQAAVTASDGTYSFSDITPGNYVVGVVSETVGGQEYLLPLVELQNDNKFAIASDYVNAYSEAISIGADTIATGIDAGMRIPPVAQTMAGEPYELQVSADGITWVSAGWYAVLGDNSSGLSSVKGGIWGNLWQGTYFKIVVMSDVTESTVLDLYGFSPTINVTITSDPLSASAYTIKTDGTNYTIFVSNSANLTLANVELNGNGSSDIGSFGVVMENGTLTMQAGSTIQNFYYGGIKLTNCNFDMYDGSYIINNKASVGGGVYLESGSIFTMNGGTISNNTATTGSGGGVYLEGGSTFTLSGGTISNNTATCDENSKGGGIAFYVQLDYAFEIYLTGGTIGGDNKATIGGGISVMNNGGSSVTLDVKGTKIERNKATNYGGGIACTNGGGGTINLTINGTTTVNENQSGGNGGGVSCDKATAFVMNGGTIDGNIASSGGGVYFSTENSASFEMYNGTISNNVSYWHGGGLYIGANQNSIIDGSAAGNEITISGNKAIHSGGGISFQWGAATLIIRDATISGNVITQNWQDERGVFGGGGGVHCGGVADWNWPSLELYDVTITGNLNQDASGDPWRNTLGMGVYMLGTGKLTMSGGEISGNIEASEGGGIYVGKKAKAEIINGKIDGNEAVGNGGGIYIADDGQSNPNKVKICDGSIISGNKATDNGGGINIENAPDSYLNLSIEEDTIFVGNVAGSAYQPPEDVYTNPRCATILSKSCSWESIYEATEITELKPLSPLNNFDINLVMYRIKLTFEDSDEESDSWDVLGNIAVTITNIPTDQTQTQTQTAIFNKEIGEYRGYPDPGTTDKGIERLSEGHWYVRLNLPNNYKYEVLLNGGESGYEVPNDGSPTDGYLETYETPVKCIEIKVTKKDTPWGRWIYKFNQ